MSKYQIIAGLHNWINQRPGLEFGNYGDVSAYRAEMRKITRARADARQLLRFIELRDSITADNLIHAAQHAYSGRLSITQTMGTAGEVVKIDYCTGQYWPTEYRSAVCAVLASAIWGWLRQPDSTGDSIRKAARLEFGRGLASRWFN